MAVLSKVELYKQHGYNIVKYSHVTTNRNVVILITYVMRMLYKSKVLGICKME